MGDRTNLFSMCKRKQNMIEEISTCSKSQQKQLELDERITPDLFGGDFGQVQVSVVCKIV